MDQCGLSWMLPASPWSTFNGRHAEKLVKQLGQILQQPIPSDTILAHWHIRSGIMAPYIAVKRPTSIIWRRAYFHSNLHFITVLLPQHLKSLFHYHTLMNEGFFVTRFVLDYRIFWRFSDAAPEICSVFLYYSIVGDGPSHKGSSNWRLPKFHGINEVESHNVIKNSAQYFKF
jgi:hypothetical protein